MPMSLSGSCRLKVALWSIQFQSLSRYMASSPTSIGLTMPSMTRLLPPTMQPSTPSSVAIRVMVEVVSRSSPVQTP